MESRCSLCHTEWDSEPTPHPSQEGNGKDADKRLLPSCEGSGVGRFMESPRDFDAVHWDLERCSAGARTAMSARTWLSALRFMESPLGLATVHFDPEPVRIPLSPAKSGGEGRERGWFMEKVRVRTRWLLAIGIIAILQPAGGHCAEHPLATGLQVGGAAVTLEADDSMIIAGGITAGKATGQEGKLRATAVVLEKQPFGKLAIIACDALMITRQHLDPVAAEIEKATGIPSANILINCTHTHHAPSTTILHGYGLDETFTRRVQRAIVKAMQDANANLSKDDCRFFFHLGEEKTVGQNSRMLLEDGQIYWVGPRDKFVRPTGPFDPELPVFLFRDSTEK